MSTTLTTLRTTLIPPCTGTPQVVTGACGMLDHRELDYWGERYVQHHIGAWTGAAFAAYLVRPDHYEAIAEARMRLALRRSLNVARWAAKTSSYNGN